MGHKYSDGCVCSRCTTTFNKALFAAVDRHEAEKKEIIKKAEKKEIIKKEVKRNNIYGNI